MGCLFCNIVSGKQQAKIVLDRPDLIAFRDINPTAPVHVLVIPKEHLTSLTDATDGHESVLGKLMLGAVEVARLEGVAESGFRTVINSGPDANQTVAHVHVHVIGGRQMTWPPG